MNYNQLGLGVGPDGRVVTLSPEDRGRHLWLLGATGTGKTKALEYYIRQDLLAWPRSRCGMLVLDLEGNLTDALLNYVAATNLTRLPIVSIDLGRGDRITSYNPLRQRIGDPDVHIAHLVRGVLNAWGQATADETPRLLLWLTIIFETLYHHSLSLAEAVHLLSNAGLRRQVTEKATDQWRKYNLEYLMDLKPDKLREELSSTIHRLHKFVSRGVIRASLCQSGASLDLLRALNEGQIILASLSTKGGFIDQEDARTFGSLLLSDLWTAAMVRGKGEDGEVKPFYLYCDEFQEYVGPALASQLNRARGYGIHITLAQQFPSQLKSYGQAGQMVLDAVTNNARTKVVFEVEHPDDTATLAEILFRQSVNIDEVKHQGYATRVLGHDVKYLPSYGTSHGTGGARGWQKSHTDGTSRSQTRQWSHTDSEGYSLSNQESDTFGQSEGWSATNSESQSESSGTGGFRGKSGGEGFGVTGRKVDENTDFEDPESSSRSRSRYSAETEGTNESRNAGRNRSATRGTSGSSSAGHTSGSAETWSTQSSDSYGESETEGVNSSDTTGTSGTESWSQGSSTTMSPMLIPRLGQEALPPQFRSIEEQLFRFTQFLSFQPKRHFWAKVVGIAQPLPLAIPIMSTPLTTRKWTERWVSASCARTGFIVSSAVAAERLAERERTVRTLLEDDAIAEPTTARRRVSANTEGTS
jgi:hypothetical protein